MTTELTYPTPTGDPGDGAEGIRPVVSVREKHVFVEPGETVRAAVSVRNVSGIIETYDLTPMGPASPWVTVLPPSVSLFPGEEETSTVTFRPPTSSAVVAGDYVVSVRARSQVNSHCMAADELVVSVEPFYRFETDIARSTFQVRTKATAQICISNKGNSTMTYAVNAVDPEDYVKIIIRDRTVTLAPGESVWIPISVKMAPRIFGTANDTRTITATIVPLRNADADIPIVDPEPANQPINLLHRPFIKLRVGLFGKFVLLIGLLALLAAFILSRILDATPPTATGAPPVPTQFRATLNDLNQPVLTWQAASGATGYTIYGVGTTADPVPTPTPTVAIEVPAATAAAVSPASAGDGSLHVTFAVAPLPRTSDMPQPSGSPAPATGVDTTLPSPVCEDCTEVASVDAGTTRFVVEQVNPGEACYRIAATVGTTQSLYSPPTCVEVRTADEQAAVAAEAAGGTDAAGGAGGGAGADGAPAGPPPPCEPVATEARAVSSTAVALLWQAASAPPKGWSTPEPSASPQLRGGEAGSKDAPASADEKVCDPALKITGWSVQRKIFTGWSDVSPEPKPNDTAVEVGDLEPDTKYCFRMSAKSATGDSRYTKKFCVKTLPAPESSASASPSEQPATSTDQPVQDAPA